MGSLFSFFKSSDQDIDDIIIDTEDSYYDVEDLKKCFNCDKKTPHYALCCKTPLCDECTEKYQMSFYDTHHCPNCKKPGVTNNTFKIHRLIEIIYEGQKGCYRGWTEYATYDNIIKLEKLHHDYWDDLVVFDVHPLKKKHIKMLNEIAQFYEWKYFTN